ncbi:flagellar biosynthesis anti-sigma factor FlgM [Desulfocurvibacter africanus]|uniref:Negative regulator of flagellin synthesis n=1 Tax=Desulfocurvibacter africanus subsp. africanus str. Walvis Bay TaxID=690850 RepID=F3Z1N2_DESAF|nr:flagellar biosynthesis anti-sigma factor FlgM [Desulfocurvibacter africanus]EGJ51167.1 flagellar biosynthesis anti-sigma factor protein FlgM [Desulfocurvibacter africanus subsp. africanus str. Walvis Bay]
MEIKNLLEGRGAYKQGKIDRTGTEAKSKTTDTESRGSDTVVLSEEARLRGQALQVANLDSGVRTDRVQELRERVKDGTYEPNLRKVAENLLRQDLDLFI